MSDRVDLLRLVTPSAARDPYPIYEQLRRRGATYHPLLDHWLLARHADVRSLLVHRGFISCPFEPSRRRPPTPEQLWLAEIQQKVLLFTEPRVHAALREPLLRVFDAPRLESATETVRAATARFVRERRDEPIDFVPVAQWLATEALWTILDVPQISRDVLGAGIRALSAALDPVLGARNLGATRAVFEEAIPVIQDVVTGAGADHPVGRLAGEWREIADDDTVALSLIFVLSAGFETTRNLLCSLLLAVAADDAARNAVEQGSPAERAAVVEEVLRLQSPVQIVARRASDRIELADRVFEPGERALGLIGAANRDPSVFDRPDQLDLARPTGRHLAFGGGAHLCIGAALARAEAAGMLDALSEQRVLPDPRDLEVMWQPAVTMRGADRLLVTLRPIGATPTKEPT